MALAVSKTAAPVTILLKASAFNSAGDVWLSQVLLLEGGSFAEWKKYKSSNI